MKVGILTFHSQLNYGGVLQCWALQTVLEKMGHEVVVVDLELDERSDLRKLYGYKDRSRWIRLVAGGFLVPGTSQILRIYRTKKFIAEKLHLTAYHFRRWKDAPVNLGVDLLVVGSDQVWRCLGGINPLPYLLNDAPNIPAIAYAASFGMRDIPDSMVDAYKCGLRRFSSISCREKEGVDICRLIGFEATHVVDPTLLDIDFDKVKFLRESEKSELVCYFLSQDIDSIWESLDDFAKQMRCKVKLFINTPVVPIPAGRRNLRLFCKYFLRQFSSRVSIQFEAGPGEFVRAFTTASWVISDSFHALMFSIRNNCNARMLAPLNPMRKTMFARIEEFANHTKGPLIVDSVKAGLQSFAAGDKVEYDYEWLRTRQERSKVWLHDAISAIE